MDVETGRVSLKEKGMVLYAFLTLSGLSIEEIAEHFLDDYDETASQRVILILNSYGFNEKNSGKFAKMHSLALKRSVFSEMDINLFKQQDIAAFVQAHPDGGTTPEEMEKFLRGRINQRLHQLRSGQPMPQPQPRKEKAVRETKPLWPPENPSVPSQQSKLPAYVAPSQKEETPDAEDPGNCFDKGNSDEKDEKGEKAAQAERKPDDRKRKWVRIVFLLLGIGLGIFVFNKSCGGNAITCVSSSGCVSSRPLSVDLKVGCISDGSFSNESMVVDDNRRFDLDEESINSFTASLSKGTHTVFVEYYKNGTLYTTDSLEFGVQKKGDHFNFLVYPVNGKLILVLTDT